MAAPLSSSCHALLPRCLCTRQGTRTAGPSPLHGHPLTSPRLAWTWRKGAGSWTAEGQTHNALSVMDHSSHWFQVLCTLLRDLSKLDNYILVLPAEPKLPYWIAVWIVILKCLLVWRSINIHILCLYFVGGRLCTHGPVLFPGVTKCLGIKR